MKYQLEFKKNYERTCNFFEIKPKGIKLKIIRDPKKFFKNKKIPWYAVGFYRGNTIILLDKNLFPSRNHKKSEFSKVMLHEMCHIFIKKIIKKRIPIWIEEGLCQFISFKAKVKPKKFVDLEKLKTYNDWYKYDNPYAYCSNFFAYLNKKYGKKKVLEFLYVLNEKKPEDSFFKIFKKNLKMAEKDFRKELRKKSKC